ATHSLSVSLTNSTPAASSSARSLAKFSMMPLWMTAIRPSPDMCGWAFRSVGPPWVAQRVCPIPVRPVVRPRSLPVRANSSSASARLLSFPARLQATSSVPSTTATPAESYPRYSSRRSPSSTIGSAGRDPTYPTIPHMPGSLPQDRSLILRESRSFAQHGCAELPRFRIREMSATAPGPRSGRDHPPGNSPVAAPAHRSVPARTGTSTDRETARTARDRLAERWEERLATPVVIAAAVSVPALFLAVFADGFL